MMLAVFFINVENEDCGDIHPKYICLRCYSSMRQVKVRDTTNTLKIIAFKPHKENDCEVCGSVPTLKKGGRKKKKPKSGRPTRRIWDRKVINEINEQTPPDVIPNGLQIEHFKQSSSLIKFCICGFCHDIIRRPLLVTPCEHSLFKMYIVLVTLEGKHIDDTEMPHM